MDEQRDTTTATRQLLVFSFPPGSRFEGQLVGALERIESGGAMRIMDALFVAREQSGELVAVSTRADGSAGMIGRLLSFRLDDATRERSTKRALDSPAGEIVRSLAGRLEPGEARAAVLIEHAWASTLAEAIGRMGGTQTVSEFVAQPEIVAAGVHLLAAPAP
jgi:hypothetical protein